LWKSSIYERHFQENEDPGEDHYSGPVCLLPGFNQRTHLNFITIHQTNTIHQTKQFMVKHLRKLKVQLRLLLVLALLLGSASAWAQVKVAGKISAKDGTTLPGVTIVVEGTTNGTTSDASGSYSITVPDTKSVLVFSFIGYNPKKVTVGNQTTLHVTLEDNQQALEEVVVVGYGTQAKRDLSGAQAHVTEAAIMERQPVSFQDALQGQAAGVFVVNDSGEPGAEGSIRIRGISTTSTGGNNPLYVVDGVPMERPVTINPNDIASIDILKDAASAAIYGSRSANGVIIITTKKGVEGKPRVDVRHLRVYGFYGHKQPQANADEVRLFRRLRGGSGAPADSLNPSYNADNDYLKIISREYAQRDQSDLSVSGAAKGLNYFSSIRYVNDKGLLLNSYQKSLAARINAEYKVNDKFKFGNRLQLSWRNNNGINESNTVVQALQRPTNFRVYMPDGSIAGYISGRRNPLAHTLYEKNETTTYGGSVFTFVEYDVTKDLKFSSNFNFQLNMPHNVRFNPKVLSSSNPTTNSGSESFDLSSEWVQQNFLNYSKKIAGAHTITAALLILPPSTT
jgi:TonB-linked SusC/RagA family outer membrane protein